MSEQQLNGFATHTGTGAASSSTWGFHDFCELREVGTCFGRGKNVCFVLLCLCMGVCMFIRIIRRSTPLRGRLRSALLNISEHDTEKPRYDTECLDVVYRHV